MQDLAACVLTLEGQVASLEVENGDLRRRLGDVEAHLGLSTGMVLSFLCVNL